MKEDERILDMFDEDKNSFEISKTLDIPRDKVVDVITDMLRNPILPEKIERRKKQIMWM